ncbi:MAG: hemerythrin domain-containing protein [SAR202 cluster bacterium]|nr:hemerythrin domain-containing protein [SAR202 cluster bacterium]
MDERPTESLRDEHEVLKQRLTRLRAMADGLVGAVDRTEMQDMFDWLVSELLPHSSDEEARLYPLVDELLAEHGGASSTMVLDHVALRSKVRDFGDAIAPLVSGAKGQKARELRDRARIITFQLEAILQLHMHKEEEVYFAAVDQHATPEQLAKLRRGGEEGPEGPAATVGREWD